MQRLLQPRSEDTGSAHGGRAILRQVLADSFPGMGLAGLTEGEAGQETCQWGIAPITGAVSCFGSNVEQGGRGVVGEIGDFAPVGELVDPGSIEACVFTHRTGC